MQACRFSPPISFLLGSHSVLIEVANALLQLPELADMGVETLDDLRLLTEAELVDSGE